MSPYDDEDSDFSRKHTSKEIKKPSETPTLLDQFGKRLPKTHEPDADEGSDQKEPQQPPFWKTVTFWTAIGSIAAVIVAGAAIRQCRHQVTSGPQRRARLSLMNSKIEGIAPGATVRFSSSVYNNGDGTAENVVPQSRFYVIGKNTEPLKWRGDFVGVGPRLTTTIIPGYMASFERQYKETLTEEVIAAIERGDSLLYVGGGIIYDDPSCVERKHPFCFVYQPVTGELNGCERVLNAELPCEHPR